MSKRIHRQPLRVPRAKSVLIRLIGRLRCGSIPRRPHKLAWLWPLTCSRSTFQCFLSILLFFFFLPPLFLFVLFTSPRYPCYCWPSLPSDFGAGDTLECRCAPLQIHGLWPWIHLVSSIFSVLITYMRNMCILFSMCVFMPYPSFSPFPFHLCDLSYINYTALHHAEQCSYIKSYSYLSLSSPVPQ